MQDYFEINISKDGKHLFATHERSLPVAGDHGKMAELLKLFREKFPESEGYKITVTKWTCRGKFIFGGC